jgi:signal transduction histidine kinase
MAVKLSEFILSHLEEILEQWERFAQSLAPGATMSRQELRNDAERMLRFIASDIKSAQSRDEQREKSQGEGVHAGATESAAFDHGAQRFNDKFSLLEMVAEYRALRASVIALWLDAPGGERVAELTRFNEAIDQALGESLQRFDERLRADQSVVLGILGHDLRTPLNVVSLSAGVLRASPALGTKEQKVTERISRAAGRIGAIANELIDFAQVQARGSIPVKRVPCDLVPVISEILDEVRLVYPNNPLSFSCPDSCLGQWDRVRLQQLVSNLVVNAIQHGAPDGTVTTRLETGEDDVVLSVHNHGHPIAVETQEEIFMPFRRGREAGDRSVGLGLYIVRQIARAHGGDAVVTRSDASGTEFSIRLPK